MSANKKTKLNYKFKKGQIVPLDDIYNFQSIGRDWWDHINGIEEVWATNDVIITRDFEIKIEFNEVK